MKAGLRKGERVRHASKTEWGVGEVLSDAAAGVVRIYFEDVGPKDFDTSLLPFIRVAGDEATSDYLTSLVSAHAKLLAEPQPGTRASKSKPKFMPFSKAAANFLSHFPDGFLDPAYLDGQHGERQYKLEAHLRTVETLGKPAFSRLLEQGAFDEVCVRAKKLVSSTNLISPYEKIWFTNGLSAPGNRAVFAESLFDLLYGPAEVESRFGNFVNALRQIHAAKWPIATYFPFLRFPDRFLFLKPMVTQEAAAILGHEINYRPEPNWLTYDRVLALGALVQKQLRAMNRPELLPRDMIDVQSFIWVTAPGYFK